MALNGAADDLQTMAEDLDDFEGVINRHEAAGRCRAYANALLVEDLPAHAFGVLQDDRGLLP